MPAGPHTQIHAACVLSSLRLCCQRLCAAYQLLRATAGRLSCPAPPRQLALPAARHSFIPPCPPRSPDHYDANGHFDGDYPANYLINQAMADRVGAAGDAHGDIDMADVPDVTVGRRLSDADAEHALLEAAKAGAHESLEGVNIGDSLPALMTEV